MPGARLRRPDEDIEIAVPVAAHVHDGGLAAAATPPAAGERTSTTPNFPLGLDRVYVQAKRYAEKLQARFALVAVVAFGLVLAIFHQGDVAPGVRPPTATEWAVINLAVGVASANSMR